MAVAFRAGASVVNGTAGTSVVLAAPARVAAGDLLVAFVGQVGIGSITAPAGWTLVASQAATTTVTLGCWTKPSTGVEPASWTFTLGASVRNWGWVGAYTGVDVTAPTAATISAPFTTSGTQFPPGSASPLPRFGSGVSAAAAVRTASGVATTWTDSGTERADLSTNGGSGTDITGTIQDSANTLDQDTTYAPTITASQSQTSGAALAITLKPLFTVPPPATPISTTVEIAPGADLTADPTTWTWVDVTSRAKTQQMRIQRGRQDRTSVTQPTQLTVRLDNPDAWLTPRHPASPWMGQWGRGTPIRVWVNLPIGRYLRAQCRVASIAPVWPAGNSQVAMVDVVAAGVLRPLSKQNTPLHSALRQAIERDGPLVYWPCEDGSNATSLAEATGSVGATPITWYNGTVALASGGPVGSAPLVTLNSNTQIVGWFRPSASASAWTLEFALKMPVAPTDPGGGYSIFFWYTNGSLPRWSFTYFSTGNLAIQAWDDTGAQQINLECSPGPEIYGPDLLVDVSARQNGGNIEVEFMVQWETGGIGNTAADPGGVTAGTLGALDFRVETPWPWDHNGLTYGHISVWDRSLDASFGSATFTHWLALGGNAGETAVARISRFATTGVPVTSVGTALAGSAAMGPQPLATALNVQREAEDADMGILGDGLGAGLRYLSGQDRQNLPVTMALDAGRGQVRVGIDPIEDDQNLQNTVTASRSTGSSATAVDPISPALEGDYPEPVTLNVADDSTLADQAAFRLAIGTVAQMRVPTLTVDLYSRPELMQQWLAMDLGFRYTTIGLMSQYPPGALDQILESYVETFDSVTWQAELTGSPFAPWRTFVIAAETGDTGEFVGHLDTDGSTLSSSIGASPAGTVESWNVATTSGPVWTTTADDFPFDINVGGEQITVTAVSGSSSPQTFTVKRAVNGVVKAHPAGAAVSVWQPLLLGL